jgi:copper resistance protein B
LTLSHLLSVFAFSVALVPTIANAQAMPGMVMPSVAPSAAPTPRMPIAAPATSDVPIGSMAPVIATPAPSATVPVVPRVAHPGWPRAVDDSPKFTYLLADLLEYQTNANGTTGIRFDALGWTGGDVNRIWFKTEGFASAVPRQREGEVSLLYGKLVKPFYDLQVGVRYVPGLGTKAPRTYAVVGYQGLAPYNFDVEPSLFISQSGKISARFTGSYDVPFSQRLILQPRLETNIALQSDAPAGIGSGIENVEFGVRLRYEIRRELAPYVGIEWLQKFGQTHVFALRDGPDRRQFPLVAGLRIWF